MTKQLIIKLFQRKLCKTNERFEAMIYLQKKKSHRLRDYRIKKIITVTMATVKK